MIGIYLKGEKIADAKPLEIENKHYCKSEYLGFYEDAHWFKNSFGKLKIEAFDGDLELVVGRIYDSTFTTD